MPRYMVALLAAALGCAAAGGSVLAQDAGLPLDEETLPEAAAPASEPVRLPGDLLDPDLLSVLEQLWGPVAAGEPAVTDGGNVTVLSVPEGFPVYSAPIGEISGAADSGPEPAVEDVVFTDEHFLGTTPLTLAVPPGDHVLAIRATQRQDGFDGGCVRKTTRDVITGGRRHSYHLYPLRKRANQYQCFVASFIAPRSTPEDVGLDLAERGTYAVPEAQLVTRLASGTRAPEEDRERVARRLNQLGVAFYEAGGARYLVKLVIVGNDHQLLEWEVE